jgi:DNA-binding transcriptional regulator YdaS (Cro superfamily)
MYQIHYSKVDKASQSDTLLTVRKRAADRLLATMSASGGVVTRADLERDGHSGRTIRKLMDAGQIVRTRQGMYRLAHGTPSGEASFVEACRIAPRGVVCLLSALSYYGLTTQVPAAVDLAVSPGTRNQFPDDLQIHYVKMLPRLLRSDVLRVAATGGGFFRIFSRERSVCDAFRYRQTVGEDIAYESLGVLLRTKFSRRALLSAAKLTSTEPFVLPPLRTLAT